MVNSKYNVGCSWPTWFGSLDLYEVSTKVDIDSNSMDLVHKTFSWWKDYASNLVSKGIAPDDILVAIKAGNYKKVKYFLAVFATCLQKNKNIILDTKYNANYDNMI